jgi:hypothetical protein
MRGSWSRGVLRVKRAQPEQLEAVRVDRIPAAASDRTDNQLKAFVCDFRGAAAASADDVVVVLLGLARHVRVISVWQVEALERTELGEEFQVAEERCATDRQPASLRVGKKIGRREVTRPGRDQVRHCLPRARDAIPAVGDGINDQIWGNHRQ